MKKWVLISLVALGVVGCNNSTGKGNADTETATTADTRQWKQGIVGQWTYESAPEGIATAIHYQMTLDIKADGQMTEREHYLQHNADGTTAIDTDGNIFEGRWALSNDTIYKEGKMQVVTGNEIKPGEKPERIERDVRGFTRLLDVRADSLLTIDQRGDTIIFTRKNGK